MGKSEVQYSVYVLLPQRDYFGNPECLWRSLHSPNSSIWNGWIPPLIPWIPYGIFLAESPAIFSFHSRHGFHGPFQVDSIGFHITSQRFNPEAFRGFHGL
jgi:hypothetical protein